MSICLQQILRQGYVKAISNWLLRKLAGLACSPEIARTVPEVAKNLQQSSGSSTGSLKERKANLMTRLGDCDQKIHNWSLLRQVENEEVCVYKVLPKNATDLHDSVTCRISVSLRPSEPTKTSLRSFVGSIEIKLMKVCLSTGLSLLYVTSDVEFLSAVPYHEKQSTLVDAPCYSHGI